MAKNQLNQALQTYTKRFIKHTMPTSAWH